MCFPMKIAKILKKSFFQEYFRTTAFLYGAVAHDSETYNFTKRY